MKGVNYRAVVIAVIASLGLDLVAAVTLAAFLGDVPSGPEVTKEQREVAVAALIASQSYQLASLVLGTLSTIIGGYLAARMARSLPYMNSFAFGLVGIVISAISAGDMPLWFNIVGFTILLPAALFGGHLAKRAMNFPQP